MAHTDTVRDVATFALRKCRVVALHDEPAAHELTDAIGELRDLLALWRIGGIDIASGASFEPSDTLAVTDEQLLAVKYNLTLILAGKYGSQADAVTVAMADLAKRHVLDTLTRFDNMSYEHGAPGMAVRN